MNTYNVEVITIFISTTNFMKYHLKMISDAIIGYELVIICYICQYSLHMSLFFHNQLYLRCRYLQCNTNIELSMNLPLPYKEKGWKKLYFQLQNWYATHTCFIHFIVQLFFLNTANSEFSFYPAYHTFFYCTS